MNTLTYKGYIGSVSFSEKDNVFFGKIEGINGLVNFEGESVKELTGAFHNAVDDYLEYCVRKKVSNRIKAIRVRSISVSLPKRIVALLFLPSKLEYPLMPLSKPQLRNRLRRCYDCYSY